MSGKPSVSINKGRAEKKALTRTTNKVFRQLKTSHQRYADVLSTLGFSLDLTNTPLIKKKLLSEKVTLLTGLKEGPWIGIAPFAAFEGKVYPAHLMEEVIKKIASKGLKIVLFGGGKHEEKILNTLESNHKNVLSVAGKISFKEELEDYWCIRSNGFYGFWKCSFSSDATSKNYNALGCYASLCWLCSFLSTR